MAAPSTRHIEPLLQPDAAPPPGGGTGGNNPPFANLLWPYYYALLTFLLRF